MDERSTTVTLGTKKFMDDGFTVDTLCAFVDTIEKGVKENVLKHGWVTLRSILMEFGYYAYYAFDCCIGYKRCEDVDIKVNLLCDGKSLEYYIEIKNLCALFTETD